MKRWSTKRKIITAIVLFVISIQIIRPQKNNGNPTGLKNITKIVTVSDSVLAVLKRSCYDCHSDYTVYPWYYEITPVNWWMTNHVNDGKRHLNFTRFGDYSAEKMDHKLEEIAETVDKDEMPLSSYIWLHGDAKLTPTQKAFLTAWVAEARKQVKK